MAIAIFIRTPMGYTRHLGLSIQKQVGNTGVPQLALHLSELLFPREHSRYMIDIADSSQRSRLPGSKVMMGKNLHPMRPQPSSGVSSRRNRIAEFVANAGCDAVFCDHKSRT